MNVEVVRSARRRKTIEAVVRNGVLRLSIPASMSETEERRWAKVMLERIERKHRSTTVDLPARARDLAARFDLPRPSSISWSEKQRTLWGSCTPSNRTIRISSRLVAFPPWVLDAVIVHELAHLVELRHGPAFRELVARYPLTERARGFLIAKGYDSHDGDGDGEGDIDDIEDFDEPAEACG
jgi:predicted metal-dependent hydrolase